MKINTIIQARMGSTRLPDKTLMKINNITLLEYLIERLKKTTKVDSTIIATTDKEDDKAIVELAKNNNIGFYTGSEDDVLDRFIKAAEKFKVNIVVRICADNPLTDPIYIDNLVDFFIAKKLDYASYRLSDGTPAILTGIGLFSEIVSLNALKKTHKLATDPIHFEHVTIFIYKHPELFKIDYLEVDNRIERAKLWLTIDTYEDFERIKHLIKTLHKPGALITIDDIISFVNTHPNAAKAMQKSYCDNPKFELMP